MGSRIDPINRDTDLFFEWRRKMAENAVKKCLYFEININSINGK